MPLLVPNTASDSLHLLPDKDDSGSQGYDLEQRCNEHQQVVHHQLALDALPILQAS